MATVAMNSAISGLNSFQSAINYISDNVANSQTVGFKRIDANFSSFVSTSSQRFFNPGGVTARPTFVNDFQGTILQNATPTSIAIAGAGWLPVQDGTSSSSGLTTNNVTQYTRRGDFTIDQNSFMVNGAGKFLYARSVPRPTAAVPNPQPNQGALVPVQINQSALPAFSTSLAVYAANLPANAAPNTTYNGGTINVVDANGATRAFAVTWYNRTTAGGSLPAVAASAANGTNAVAASGAGTVPQWRAVITAPTSSANGNESLVVDFSFGTTVGTNAGLLTGMAIQSTLAGSLTATTTGTDGRLSVSYSAPGLAAAPQQTFNVEFGTPNTTSPTTASTLSTPGGMSQFGGTTISISTVSSNGYGAGTFKGIGIDTSGNIFTTYTNGQRLTQYQIALGTFNNPKGLVRQNGEAFLDDPAAGFIGLNASGSGGAGGINPQSLENSNVDIGAEFTKMIVAQRSYSANARMITTSDEMLQEVVNLKR